MSLRVHGRDQHWTVSYPNEERLASPFPVYDKEGLYKHTIWCGNPDSKPTTDREFVGSESEAVEYARFLLPGVEVEVTYTLTKAEVMARARAARKEGYMNPAEITIGARLLLKTEAKQRYGFTDPVVTVTAVTRNGYKTPWILGKHVEITQDNGVGAFRPSDFSRVVKETASEANARVASLARRKTYT